MSSGQGFRIQGWAILHTVFMLLNKSLTIPWPQVTYPFKDLYKEIILGNPKRLGSLGSRYCLQPNHKNKVRNPKPHKRGRKPRTLSGSFKGVLARSTRRCPSSSWAGALVDSKCREARAESGKVGPLVLEWRVYTLLRTITKNNMFNLMGFIWTITQNKS